MPIELEISELPEVLSVTGQNILHSKEREGITDGGDVQMRVQDILDLVPATDFTSFVPATESTINTTNDFAMFSDASASGEIKRISFSDFVTALSIPSTSGSLTSGYFEISGLQFRWGTISSTNDNSESFTFAVPFTNECFGVWVSNGQLNPTNPIQAVDTSISLTGFDIDRNSNISGTVACRYFALGR